MDEKADEIARVRARLSSLEAERTALEAKLGNWSADRQSTHSLARR